jgi:rhodanese-related sulfurtransferase
MSSVFPPGNGIEVTPEDTQRVLADGTATVIDVREGYEREAGYIDGSEHIELDRLASRRDDIPRDRPVVFYCRLGARSAMAAQAFQAAGFEAKSMAGGIVRWDRESRPLAPEGGTVADH